MIILLVSNIYMYAKQVLTDIILTGSPDSNSSSSITKSLSSNNISQATHATNFVLNCNQKLSIIIYYVMIVLNNNGLVVYQHQER